MATPTKTKKTETNKTEKKIELPKAELERQLDNALQDTFPASDPVSVGEVTKDEPVRPLHRRPAAIDKALVDRLAREVTEKRKA